MKKLLLALLLVFGYAGSAHASALAVYLAQSATGTADGSSCAAARAASYFNSSGNWGSGATQIGPGTQVFLCGTVSTNLTFQGDGTAGNPVILDGRRHDLTPAVLNAAISTNGKNYWTIKAVAWQTSYPSGCPIVVNIPGGGFGSVEDNMMDTNDPGPIIFLAQNASATGLSHDISIKNNYLRNAATTTACQSDIIDTEGSFNVIIEGNYFEMRSRNNDQHDDIIQTYQKGGATAGPPHDWVVRNNRLVMNTDSPNNKSYMMMEALSGLTEVYGNSFYGPTGGDSGNGVNFNGENPGFTAHIYNNSMYSANAGPNNMWAFAGTSGITFTNNVTQAVSAGNQLTGTPTRSHNIWFGSGAPSCTGTDICSNPLFVSVGTGNLALQSGSPARSFGTNLGSTYATYVLATSTWPDPVTGTRPGSPTLWDGGYTQFSSAPPAPNTSFSPTSIPFGSQTVLTTSGILSTTLTNSGTATLNIVSINLATGVEFAISSTTCGLTLGVSASCVINVRFTPLTIGLKSDSIQVTDDAAGSPQSVPLSGTGISVSVPTQHKPVIMGSLPGGIVGQPYSSGLTVTGAQAPNAWSVNPTVPGLTLNSSTGMMTGTPLSEGTYPLVFRVSDSFQCNAAADCSTASDPYPVTLVIAATPPPPNVSTIQVNSGGPAYLTWSADKGCVGGNSDTYTHAITPAVDQKLYQSERWGVFTCTYPVPAGVYAVTLKFAENSFSRAGQRIFSVTLNGSTVLSNFDIVSQSGGEWRVVDKTFNVTTTGNPIVIGLVRGSADQPSINAIQIALVTAPPPPPPPPPPPQGVTLTCTWLPDGVTRRCDAKTVGLPTGQNFRTVVSTGNITVTDNAPKP